MLNTMSKMRGQVKTTGYPQTEDLLGDCMLRYGQELGEDSVFGTSHSLHPHSPIHKIQSNHIFLLHYNLFLGITGQMENTHNRHEKQNKT
jgi:hypothetical protein